MKNKTKDELEKSFWQHQHSNAVSHGFSTHKYHPGSKSYAKKSRHIQQPTRGRGVK